MPVGAEHLPLQDDEALNLLSRLSLNESEVIIPAQWITRFFEVPLPTVKESIH